MNPGFKFFLKALRLGGLAPSTGLHNYDISLFKKRHFIYPCFAMFISWFCALRYFVFLAFFNPDQYSVPQTILYVSAICYYVISATIRTEFVWKHWKNSQHSPIILFQRCNLEDPNGKLMVNSIEDFTNHKESQRLDSSVWKYGTIFGFWFINSNGLFFLILTILQKYDFGGGSTIATFHLVLRKHQDKEWLFYGAAVTGMFLNTFTDASCFIPILGGALTFNVATRFIELAKWLKNRRINGKKINLVSIQNYYCHLVDLIKEIDDFALFRNGMMLSYAYFGLLISFYQIVYGDSFKNEILSRFVFAFWTLSYIFEIFLVVWPSIYVNKKARKAKLEMLKFKINQFTDESSDWHNANLQHFFARTPNDGLSLTYFKLAQLNGPSLLMVCQCVFL